MAALRAAYRPGTGVADAFARFFDSLLGPHGLVVFDASDPAAKPFVADLFAREIRDAGRTASLAATAGDALAALGHAPQVTPQADTAALFHVDGVRRQIRRQDDGLAVGDDRFTVDALAAEAAASPQHFSPNVLLRPIVQDRLFPTVVLCRRTERARVPRTAPRRLRELRHPDAADVSARDGNDRRLGDSAFPRPLRRPVRRLCSARTNRR